MNCKPGDLAIVISKRPCYAGRLVEVLYAPPSESFELPDGQYACCKLDQPKWVIKFIGGPAPASLDNGTTRQTWYGVGADRCLKPLRGDPDAVEPEAHKEGA